MKKAVCTVPVSPMRVMPAHKSEMVSQLVFGETVILHENEAVWQKVKADYDGYEGWCLASQLTEIHAIHSSIQQPLFTADWVNTVLWNGSAMYLPFGCDLSLFHQERYFNTPPRMHYEGKIIDNTHAKSFADRVDELSKIFLNTTYLWGGKSVFGIDCSGFTQTVFKVIGIPLLRDAWQQAEQGFPIPGLSTVQPGDLVFFDNEEGRITHVGIVRPSGKIIHASGKVRIDTLDASGIVNDETGIRTHRLHSIRRYSSPT